MLQRKERFEKLRELQGLMENTTLEKPPGTDFLEEIYARKEKERLARMETAAKNEY